MLVKIIMLKITEAETETAAIKTLKTTLWCGGVASCPLIVAFWRKWGNFSKITFSEWRPLSKQLKASIFPEAAFLLSSADGSCCTLHNICARLTPLTFLRRYGIDSTSRAKCFWPPAQASADAWVSPRRALGLSSKLHFRQRSRYFCLLKYFLKHHESTWQNEIRRGGGMAHPGCFPRLLRGPKRAIAGVLFSASLSPR